MRDINILSLFGINVEDLELYEEVDSSSDSVTFLIRKRKEDFSCKACGSFHLVTKDYKPKKYVFNSMTGIKVNILFEHRRYVCKDCGKTLMEPNPFVKGGNYKVSPKKILEVINYLKDGLPATLISKYSFISVSSVNNILDTFVKVKRRRLPEIVSIDEFCSFNSSIESKYSCLMIDYLRGIVIDVLPSRRSCWIDKYLSEVPPEEIKNVKYVVMDMYKPYKDCFRKHNPSITFVVDAFHYVSYVTDAMERVRVRVMKKFLTTEPEYKLLKRYRKLLITKYEPDSYRKLKRVKILDDQRMYSSEILLQILDIDKDLEDAYDLGHTFLKTLDSLDYDKFKAFLGTTIIRFKCSGLKEFNRVGETFENWRTEIENSYLPIDNGKRISNARIEGRNNKIKTLKKVCYGLTNFEHMKKRIFLIFDKDPTKKQ